MREEIKNKTNYNWDIENPHIKSLDEELNEIDDDDPKVQ